jgi:RNA-directed DNA polymerase
LNSDASWPTLQAAEARVLGIQRKLHRWAQDDQERRFKDLHNLVCEPATLVVAWHRVRANRGSRTAGVDGTSARDVEQAGVVSFLSGLRRQLRDGSYRPTPVRERAIPKRGGKVRRLGIATIRDRVVQAALKLVIEPVFEADFQPCSFGFRPGRRAQDAIAEVHHFTSRSYEWIVEADITACFDELEHSAVLGRVHRRIADKRVLALVKAFLKAGIVTELGSLKRTVTGTPQGGIASPLLANIALSALDDHFARAWQAMGIGWQRQLRRRQGKANYRLIRYADDFIICVAGDRGHADALVDETARVLAPLGLRLSEEKTRVTHIDEGIDFLGWRIKRQRQRGGDGRRHVYTYPSKRSLASVKAKVRQLTRGGTNQTLGQLVHRLNPVLRGWCSYFRHGACKQTFNYLRAFVWRRVVAWLRRKYPKRNWGWLLDRYLLRWWPTDGTVVLFNPGSVRITRYRWRGQKIPTPWEIGTLTHHDASLGLEHLQLLLDL